MRRIGPLLFMVLLMLLIMGTVAKPAAADGNVIGPGLWPVAQPTATP